MPKSLWRRIARDPILHFAVLAGLLFGLHAVFSRDQKPTIQVDAAVIDALLQERAVLTQRPQTEKDRQEVIDTYIAEEVLLREAYRRGLDRAPRIRAQLVQAMRFALSTEPPKPSETILRAYFAANRDRFQRPATVSLAQLFFGDGETPPDDMLVRLNSVGNAGRVGEPDMRHAASLRHATRDDIARSFDPTTAEAIEAIDDRLWHGPFPTPRGTYYIRIDERQPAGTPSYEQVARHIADEWTMARQQEIIEQRVAELGRGFTVILPPGPAKQ